MEGIYWFMQLQYKHLRWYSLMLLLLNQTIRHYFYWFLLGVLSSVGFGMHTFILFLTPLILSQNTGSWLQDYLNCFWEILLWGIGTSVGELPPYFYSRYSSKQLSFLKTSKTLFSRAQLFLYRLIHSLGFFGILLCASFPNPFFDLAGIICGHFHVSFFTFFGATLIGKAFIKCHLQSIALLYFRYTQSAYLSPFLDRPKEESSVLSNLWNLGLSVMVIYFLFSLMNSIGLEYKHQLLDDTSSVDSLDLDRLAELANPDTLKDLSLDNRYVRERSRSESIAERVRNSPRRRAQ